LKTTFRAGDSDQKYTKDESLYHSVVYQERFFGQVVAGTPRP